MTRNGHQDELKRWNLPQPADCHSSLASKATVSSSQTDIFSAMRTVRFTWPLPWQSADYCERQISDSELAAGTFTPPDAEFPGLPGVYTRLRAEMAWAIDPEHPLPTFLHESYKANIETWTLSVADPADELAGIEETRNSLTELVEYRKRTLPGSFLVSAVMTSTDQTNSTLRIWGRCVMAHPA